MNSIQEVVAYTALSIFLSNFSDHERRLPKNTFIIIAARFPIVLISLCSPRIQELCGLIDIFLRIMTSPDTIRCPERYRSSPSQIISPLDCNNISRSAHNDERTGGIHTSRLPSPLPQPVLVVTP